MAHNSQKRLPTRRLSIEGLESRTLMAGNVTATVEAGVLAVTGDNADNLVYLRQLPSQPSTTWQGFRYSIESWTPRYKLPTTINGQAAVVVEGVKNVNIDMKDGGDRVYVGNPSRPGAIANLPG